VSQAAPNDVLIYPTNQPGSPPIGSISTGIKYPIQIAADGAGTLYVANRDGPTVTEYPRGQTVPSVTLSQGLISPLGVAVDSAGTVYVSNQCSKQSILEYPAGSQKPSARIRRGLGCPVGLALDKAQNLYIADSYLRTVLEVAKGTRRVKNLNLAGLVWPQSVAFDGNGDMFVSDVLTKAPSGAVRVYHPGQTQPFRQITVDVHYAYFTTFGPTGALYVANDYVPGGSVNVSVYRPGASIPFERFSNGLGQPVGVVVIPPA
jgi:hypothetical protein